MANTIWYKPGLVYVIDVRAYMDSNGDGSGDLNGLARKLDHLADLGVNAVCLQPLQPSPEQSAGFDLVDLRSIAPAVGQPRSFRDFLREAGKRQIAVIIDLVVGYTSDQHPWFQRARQARADSSWRAWYLWRPSLPHDRPNWWRRDERARAYYRHAGRPHEPMLNLEKPAVLKALCSAAKTWLKRGVDGLRLHGLTGAAVAQAYANTQVPINAMRYLRARLSSAYPHAVFVTAAKGATKKAQAYFGAEDASHLVTEPEVASRLFAALLKSDRKPVVEYLRHQPAPPEDCQWALSLRDHRPLSSSGLRGADYDLLRRAAFEGRGREERPIYRRLSPLLRNDAAGLRLLFSLLLSLPGTPFIWYGDEIQMGDNIFLPASESLRLPMQWSHDRNGGFSMAEPSLLVRPSSSDSIYGPQATNVALQWKQPASLLWWLKRQIEIRQSSPALTAGGIEFLAPANSAILAYLRRHQDEKVICVANLSRMTQAIDLDLSAFNGLKPVEMASQSQFATIETRPFPLVLPAHGYYWLKLAGVLKFYSCFISYSSNDDFFVQQLYHDLTAREIDCWKASENLRAGELYRKRIEERIRGSDRIVVVCSKNALASKEVEKEVKLALAEEKRRQSEQHHHESTGILLPIRLDDSIHRARQAWARRLNDKVHIADFRHWRESEAYQKALGRLLHSLAREERPESLKPAFSPPTHWPPGT